MNKVCFFCKKEYSRNKNFSDSQWKEQRFCSHPCFNSYKRKEGTKDCNWCRKKFYARSGAKYCSLICRAKGITGKKHTKEHNEKIKRALKGKPKTAEHIAKLSGKNCHLWRGGITPINKQIRTSSEYKQWRAHVFNRDDFTCQACGERGGKLNADHELPFSQYPDLRFEVLNGRTFCEACHKIFGWSLFRERNPRSLKVTSAYD